jgi:hypothetical protein
VFCSLFFFSPTNVFVDIFSVHAVESVLVFFNSTLCVLIHLILY